MGSRPLHVCATTSLKRPPLSLPQTGNPTVRKPVKAAGQEYAAIISAQDRLAEQRERQERELRRQQAQRHRSELDRLVQGARR